MERSPPPAPAPPPNTRPSCQVIRTGRFSSLSKALVTLGPCTLLLPSQTVAPILYNQELAGLEPGAGRSGTRSWQVWNQAAEEPEPRGREEAATWTGCRRSCLVFSSSRRRAGEKKLQRLWLNS
ncbi:unnamed protein product [Pleuronectes platessa]|uniref:Uncharacterized protein n=1 Tax=Pleuronectes platessa TaxID=8262 RepID=A0A9N7Y4S7_PLEPL|nr:unnamed protein product [Pleuronectes platessa]